MSLASIAHVSQMQKETRLGRVALDGVPDSEALFLCCPSAGLRSMAYRIPRLLPVVVNRFQDGGALTFDLAYVTETKLGGRLMGATLPPLSPPMAAMPPKAFWFRWPVPNALSRATLKPIHVCASSAGGALHRPRKPVSLAPWWRGAPTPHHSNSGGRWHRRVGSRLTPLVPVAGALLRALTRRGSR